MGCEFIVTVYVGFLLLAICSTIVGYIYQIRIMINVCLVLSVLSLLAYPLYFYGELKECAARVEISYIQPPSKPCDLTCGD